MESEDVIDRVDESMSSFIHSLRMKGVFNEELYKNLCLCMREASNHFKDDSTIHKDLALMLIELPILAEGAYGLLSEEDRDRLNDCLHELMDISIDMCTH